MPDLETLLADYRRDATKINALLQAVTQFSMRVSQGIDSTIDHEDVAQETVIAIYRYLPEIKEEITPLVVHITRNKVIDAHRKRKIKHREKFNDEGISSPALVSEWQRRKLEIASEVLGERITTLMENGYTHEEISELTGISVNTIRSRIQRARKLFLLA